MAANALPPKHSQILVIGGGPSGSYAASVLAREGMQVTLLEAAEFPRRYHIGESLIPSARHYMKFIDAEEKLVQAGFKHKPGAAIKFNQHKKEGYTDFVALGIHNSSWNVIRSQFDDLLLQHARTCGIEVFERTKVDSVEFSTDNTSRPVAVNWTRTSKSASPSPGSHRATGRTSFNYLVDASGRAGVMSTKYMKNRHFNESLKNIAIWGYWRGAGTYGVGTSREGAPWFEALTDESGWAWFIPLHDGTTSVGVVMNQQMFTDSAQGTSQSPFSPETAPNPRGSTMTSRYLAALGNAPQVVELLTDQGRMVEDSVKSASDYSYKATEHAGPNFRICGDAGAFIDPCFSSGIHLALTSAMSAAASICAAIRGDCTEEAAGEWHTERVMTSYTRFQLVVLSAYKQFRNQAEDVLSDIDEDNFDRAFAMFRPVIQGGADIGIRLSEDELQRSLDFCANLFNPTTPEQHAELVLGGEIAKDLLDVNKPVVDRAVLNEALHVRDEKDGEARLGKSDGAQLVLDKINARRVIQPEYAISNMENEGIDGYAVRLQRGNLGLNKVVS
ncbi:FAD/NAD(P)-binding domain-containing protein [Schizophyllum commune Tattone D]|nr:FAD/NAD(P)-binding domain-containing protein [Schizophyllum commune Tattone D]